MRVRSPCLKLHATPSCQHILGTCLGQDQQPKRNGRKHEAVLALAQGSCPMVVNTWTHKPFSKKQGINPAPFNSFAAKCPRIQVHVVPTLEDVCRIQTLQGKFKQLHETHAALFQIRTCFSAVDIASHSSQSGAHECYMTVLTV